MRQLYAAVSSSFIHLLCAFLIYSLWYSVHDIPPAQAAEVRILDIGMLQGEVLSQQQQSASSEASQALASLDAQASDGEKEAADPVEDSLTKEAPVVEPIAETKPEPKPEPTKVEAATPADAPIVESEPEHEPEPEPKVAETPKPVTKPVAKIEDKPIKKAVAKSVTKPIIKSEAKPSVKPVTKSSTESAKSADKTVVQQAAKQAQSQAMVGSGLAQRNQIRQEGAAAQSLGGQGQAQGRAQGASYLASLLHTISQRAARSYPTQARQMRHEGRARVAFKILDDGRFSDIRLLHSSGHHSLDQAALGTVQRLGKYTAPPAGVNRQVSTTIVFSLKR
ncbi:MAG: energy transducer TonB [Pelistega sp.]|nr:energy transducer TonB [Pelistega sp.]